jgi:HSP20 family protein
MNMKNLIPWGRRNVRVRREGDKSFYSLQRSINQVFDDFFEGFDLGPFGLGSSMTSFSPRLDVVENERERRRSVPEQRVSNPQRGKESRERR